MKIRPLQQVADHIARAADSSTDKSIMIADVVCSVKWKLWYSQVDRAIDQLETISRELAIQCNRWDPPAEQLLALARPLLTYVRSNCGAIVEFGARYRSGRRIASSRAESTVVSLVAKRMVKKQQMQWSP